MRFTGERIELSENEVIRWEEVKTLRLSNNKLALVLEDGRVIELENLRPNLVDQAFLAYEKYLKHHPKRQRRR